MKTLEEALEDGDQYFNMAHIGVIGAVFGHPEHPANRLLNMLAYKKGPKLKLGAFNLYYNTEPVCVVQPL